MRSTATHGFSSSRGGAYDWAAVSQWRVVLRTSDGFEASAICWPDQANRLRPGGAIGTATTPAYKQPKNAATKSSPGGNSRIARSPGSANRCKWAAMAMARRSRSPKVIDVSERLPLER